MTVGDVPGAAATADVVIVGAGLAGAATAFFLSRERGLRIALLEQEATAGVHSSGRNAGLVRRASGDRALDPLCDEGAAFLAMPPDDFPGTTGFRRTGSFLIAAEPTVRAWQRERMRIVPHAELQRAVPPFRVDPEKAGTAVLHTEDDGVVDPAALLAGFLAGARARGVAVRMGEGTARIAVERGRVVGVATAGGVVASGVVVDAAGAWAAELAAAAGARPHGLRPLRRHLLLTRPDRRVAADWPWVWDETQGFYFRPDDGGLLLCACDEEAEEPGACVADPAMEAVIRAKLRQSLPTLADLETRRLWAGHRTLRPDGRFVLGADEVGDGGEGIHGLVWAAGLGGHGVTAAAAVGRCVAEAARARLR